MDIAAISMNLSTATSQMSAGIAVTKKAMDQQQTEAAGLIQMMETAMPPSEHILDIKV